VYQIIGTQRNTKQRLVATPQSATEALAQYVACVKDFRSVKIVDPSGASIDLDELSRRAREERNA
jgi:hypothetical protein